MRALIVEDEPALMDFLCTLLTNAGLVVDRTASIDAALSALRAAPFDIAVIDRRLPDGDGLSIVKAMSAQDPRPAFLLLTARDAKADVVEGLNGGADDYLVKPFDLLELEARIQAVLRRPGERQTGMLSCGDLTFDVTSREGFVGNRAMRLARREAAMLEELLRAAGRTVVRDVLEERLYTFNEPVTPNAIEAVVSRLRRKLEVFGSSTRIQTKRGIGYRISDEPELAS